MKTFKPTLLSLPLLALPLLVGFVPRADNLSFGPEAGASVSKELEVDLKVYLEDIALNVDGQELPSEMIMGEIDEGIVVNAVISVTDEFVKSGGGRHLELLRTYDSMSLEGGPESETESMDEFGEYEDSTIRFEWSEDDDEYKVTFADGEGDSDVLVGLDADMDFLALLPDGEVSEGDTWQVSGAKLGTVFLPGGMVPLDMDMEEAEMLDGLDETMMEQFEQAFSEFTINCEYAGERDEDGKKVGAIKFKYDGEASVDLSDVINEVLDGISSEQGIDMSADIVASLDLQVKGEGNMLWDLEAHHCAAFEMSSDMTLLADVEAEVEAEGEAHSMEASAELSGEASWSMSAE